MARSRAFTAYGAVPLYGESIPNPGPYDPIHYTDVVVSQLINTGTLSRASVEGIVDGAKEIDVDVDGVPYLVDIEGA